MYKILGADQREYGPVTVEQIQQWIAEGRANGATQAQAEGQPDWHPLSHFPEFSEALSAQAAAFQPPRPPGQTLAPLPAHSLPRTAGVNLDIGSCVGRSWQLFQQNAGVLIGATVIFLVVVVGVNQLIGLITRPMVQSLMAGEVTPGPILVLLLWNIPEMALTTVLTAGLYGLLLKLIRGVPGGVGDVFMGFTKSFGQLAAAGIVVQLLTLLGLLACIIPGIYLSVAWIMTVPLIIDRRLGFWAAMELSRTVVTQRWWVVFCLVLVVALIALAGLLACCIGLVAALPIGLGALVYAYEDIFGGPGSIAS